MLCTWKKLCLLKLTSLPTWCKLQFIHVKSGQNWGGKGKKLRSACRMVRHVDVRHIRGAPGGAKWKLPAMEDWNPLILHSAVTYKALNPSLGNDKKHCISSAQTKLLLTLPHITTVTVKNPLLNKDIQ